MNSKVKFLSFILSIAIVGSAYAQAIEVVGGGVPADTGYKVTEGQDTVITHKYPDGKTVIEGSAKAIEDFKTDIAYVQPDGSSVGFRNGDTGERMTYEAYMERTAKMGSSQKQMKEIESAMGYSPKTSGVSSGVSKVSSVSSSVIKGERAEVNSPQLKVVGKVKVWSGFSDDVKKVEPPKKVEKKVVESDTVYNYSSVLVSK